MTHTDTGRRTSRTIAPLFSSWVQALVMTSDLTQVAVSPDSDDYKNVFCNPAFELEGEREDRVEGFRTASSTPEPIKPAAAGQGVFQVCALRFRVWSGCGLGAVLVSAAIVFLVAALGLTLVLILTQLSGQEVEEGEVVSVSPTVSHTVPAGGGGGGLSQTVPTLVSNSSVGDIATTAAPQPTGRSPTAQTRCGGILSDPEGSFSSPNHPGSYPPNSQCVWVIRVPPPALVQIHVSSLTVEGPSPCLFDWLEVREQSERSAVVTRFCGSVAPPTVNSNSSVVLVTFHSDASISGAGFTAQYRAVQSKSCFREEFQCDGGRCLLPVSVCDGHAHCTDQSDEAHCEHIHRECGGQKNGSSGYLTSPNHPRPYPHQQLCTWRISAEEGHVITLSFQNFSLEAQDVCEFDYVEIHDSADTGAGRTLGRFCGTDVPPEMTSSGPQMTVVFVADEGVSDTGFSATYQAVSVANRTCAPEQFSCSTGECLQREWICDGWNDCYDGGDERNCGNATYPQFTSSCELIEVQMCRDLSYNQTSFPNIWLSVADQREASMMLTHYQVLTELPCFEPLRRLLCGMFVPQCSPHGGVLQPCRSVCSSAQLQCAQALDVFAFSWPFNCHLLPDSQDPMECCLP